MPDRPLTLKQERFVNHYTGDAHGNATAAARLAGYQGNPLTIKSIAAENLSKPSIAAQVRARVDAAGATADWVLSQLVEVARMQNAEFLSAGRDSKATLADKVRALELLGKYHRLWTERIEIDTQTHVTVALTWDDQRPELIASVSEPASTEPAQPEPDTTGP